MPKPGEPTSILADERCPIPGCRDHRLKSTFVCLGHAVEIRNHVQAANREPLIENAILESVADREKRMHEQAARRTAVSKTNGTLYFIRLDDKIKIGWTSSLGQRLHSYPPHAQLLVDQPGTRADERDLHRTFKPSRAAGREWYHPTGELTAHIERTLEAETRRRTSIHRMDLAAKYGADRVDHLMATVFPLVTGWAGTGS